MKITLTLAVLVVCAGALAADEEKKKLQDPLVGKWEGTLDMGDAKHAVTIEVKRRGDKFTGTLSIAEQVDKLALEEIVWEDEGLIRLVFPLNPGSYEGKIVKDDFKGVWKQGGAGIGLTLKRAKVEGK
jgi:hypothetical protein